MRIDSGYVRDAQRIDAEIEVEADGRWRVVDSAGNERFFHARMRDGHLVVVYDTSDERNPLDYPTRETTAVAAEPPTFATGGRWAMAEYDTFDGKTIVPSACVQLGNQRSSCETITGLEAEQRTGYVSESEAGAMIATVARNGSAAERTSFRMQGDHMLSESCGPEPACSDQFTRIVLKHTAK